MRSVKEAMSVIGGIRSRTMVLTVGSKSGLVFPINLIGTSEGFLAGSEISQQRLEGEKQGALVSVLNALGIWPMGKYEPIIADSFSG